MTGVQISSELPYAELVKRSTTMDLESIGLVPSQVRFLYSALPFIYF